MSSPRFVVDPSSNAKLMREVSQPANSGACDAKRAKESSQTQQKNIDRCMSDPRGQKRHEQEKTWRGGGAGWMPHACFGVGWTMDVKSQDTAEESRDYCLRHKRRTTQTPPGNELSNEVNDCARMMV